MPQYIYKFILFIGIFVMLTSCGTSKHNSVGEQEKLPKIKTSVLLQRMDSLANRSIDFFYAKMHTKYEGSDKNLSFKTSIRMRKDSAINAMISFARIPIYIGMVTKDSVTLVDKRNKCYIKEGISYFKNSFNVDFNYRNLEELLLGMPLGWKDLETHYRIKNPYQYILVAKRKRGERLNNDMTIRYYLDTTGTQLEQTIINRPKDGVIVTISYSNRKNINGFIVPTKEEVEIETNEGTIRLYFDYNKLSINEPRVLFLSIPKKYERCE